MAVLTANGITFGDSTQLNSRYGIVPQNSVELFLLSSAPTGWTQVTNHNNKALRVVGSTGGGSAGTNPFTSTFTTLEASGTSITSGSVSNYTLTTTDIPSHTHPYVRDNNSNQNAAGGCCAGANLGIFSTTTGSTGSGGAHSHSFTGSSSPYSSSIDMSVAYVDCILCSFN